MLLLNSVSVCRCHHFCYQKQHFVYSAIFLSKRYLNILKKKCKLNLKKKLVTKRVHFIKIDKKNYHLTRIKHSSLSV